MRQRTKMSGLVSHTCPNGKSYTSAENKCRCGINRIQKLLNEGYDLIGAKKKHEGNPREVIVSFFGGQLKMTFTEYQQHGKDLKVVMKIF